MPEALGRDLAAFALQRWHHVDSVELEIARAHGASHRENRRQPVGEMNHVVDLAAAVEAGGPSNHHRQADSALVHECLRAGEAAIETVGAHLAHPAELRPVVAREHHDRVVGEARAVERVEHARNSAIHAFDHRVDLADRRREVAARLVRLGVSLGCLERKMRRVVREV